MMAKPAVRGEPHELSGPAGLLEALVEGPVASPRAVGVVCHPHPLHEGSMHNKVVHSLARSFVRGDARVVRFNFRGVGASEGRFDDARGETEDALAVIDWVRGEYPDRPLWLAGFSFGAQVALQAAPRARPDALITVAPPVARFGENPPAEPVCPWLLIQGESDEVVDPASVHAWARKHQRPPQVARFADTGHFFHRRLTDLQARVTVFLESLDEAA